MKNEKIAELLKKEKYSSEDLIEIMEILRGEDGCPWDREQTHESIRKNFIEETYEVVEAIDNRDRELLCEELGDVLLQVVFHARIAEEDGEFTFDDVVDGICKKLIERHPHIFADVNVENVGDVLKNWDQIKQEKKKQKTVCETMDSVSRALPSLMRAEKLIGKAEKAVGVSDMAVDTTARIKALADKLGSAAEIGDTGAENAAVADMLFELCRIARKNSSDPEQLLYNRCEDFIAEYRK